MILYNIWINKKNNRTLIKLINKKLNKTIESIKLTKNKTKISLKILIILLMKIQNKTKLFMPIFLKNKIYFKLIKNNKYDYL